jgi:prophage antirepressor-like protein
MPNDRPVKVQLFESAHIRSAWDEDEEKWWFSALDIVAALTDQPDYAKVRNYWKWLKNKLKQEGGEVVSATNQLKLEAPDGKQRLTDVLDTQQVFRIIQSIPSSKAEPFKLWLAEVANQRLDQLRQISQDKRKK